MERHFSTGVATLTALMAAHRAASAKGQSRLFSQEEVARIDIHLRGDDPGASPPCQASILWEIASQQLLGE